MSVVINLKDVLNAQGGLLRSPSLAEDAAQTLRKMILLEKLPPGTALPERDLSQALGISRTPLREAIRLLAGEGLVQYTAARRPFVADPSLEEINDCLRIQVCLKPWPENWPAPKQAHSRSKILPRLMLPLSKPKATIPDCMPFRQICAFTKAS